MNSTTRSFITQRLVGLKNWYTAVNNTPNTIPANNQYFLNWAFQHLVQNPQITWAEFYSEYLATPCIRVQKAVNDTDYKANLLDLQGKTSLNYEVAYTISDLPATSTEPRNKYFTGAVNAAKVQILITQYLRSAMHTHYKNLHPIFSPEDLKNYSEWINAIKEYNAHPALTPAEKVDLKTLTATVVTPIGNYLIIFDGTDFTPLPAYTEEEYDNLVKEYNEKLDKTLTSVVPQKVYDVNKFETEFLKFLRDKMPINGLKLYKVESTGNTEIYLENDTKKPNPCPII